VLWSKEQLLPILKVLGLTWPARAGLELMTSWILSENDNQLYCFANQDTDQARVWFWSTDFSRSYGLSQIISFPHFFFLVRAFRYSVFIWYLVHCFATPRYRSSSSLVLNHWFFVKLSSRDLNNICTFVVPLQALQSRVVTNQNLVLLYLNYFDWMYHW
jgi:hypothetical protein